MTVFLSRIERGLWVQGGIAAPETIGSVLESFALAWSAHWYRSATSSDARVQPRLLLFMTHQAGLSSPGRAKVPLQILGRVTEIPSRPPGRPCNMRGHDVLNCVV
jgi:hypothetical protein